MAEHPTPATCGVDHVGLSVRDLESTRRFFCDGLGWRVVGERPEYPAAFVSDGHQIVTLWRGGGPPPAGAFLPPGQPRPPPLTPPAPPRARLEGLFQCRGPLACVR